ncbi:diguanylate cyclase [Vibrio furnissii]|uniref:diguanylate cyclase n=1 Tax=Vibrio furnissii TaxID=29494 RepID=UPI0024B9BB17|nr:diguanylate cyclase [Vibrio furnissii]WHR53534.1 diguanylate cyclase [Vibrio furnissii]
MSELSLRTKLLLPIFMLMTLIFVIAQGFGLYTGTQLRQTNLIERVNVLSKGVAYNLQAAMVFDDQLAAQEVLSAFSADKDVVRVKLYDATEQLFAMYERYDSSAPIPNAQQREQIQRQQYAISEDYIYLRVPVVIDETHGASLRVIISKQSIAQLYQSAMYNATFFFSLLFMGGLILYWMAQRMILSPVLALNQAVQAYIERQERRQTLVRRTDDEIGHLVQAFNTMLDKLDQRERQVLFTLDKLEQEKSFANEVVDTVQHALVVVDAMGMILHANDAANHVFKCTRAYLRGANLLHVLKTDQLDVIQAAIRNETQLDEQLVVATDVRSQPLLLRVGSRALSRDGQTLFAIQDVTQIEIARRRQRLAAAVFENSQDGLMVLNAQGDITLLNPAVSQLIGYHRDALLDKPLRHSVAWQQLSLLMPAITEAVAAQGHWQGEVWEQHQDGHLVPLLIKVNRISLPEAPHDDDMVFMISDLSNIKEMERLAYLAHHDSLTGLANRSELYRVVEDILASNHNTLVPFALIYLDLDGFKQVNDSFGHDAGDEVLKQVSERLLSQVRSHDLVARLSGDEFVLVIYPSERDSVTHLANRLLTVIAQDMVYRGQVLRVGASMGVYYVDDANLDLDTVMKSADSAMYQAKCAGKGRYILMDHTRQRTLNS